MDPKPYTCADQTLGNTGMDPGQDKKLCETQGPEEDAQDIISEDAEPSWSPYGLLETEGEECSTEQLGRRWSCLLPLHGAKTGFRRGKLSTPITSDRQFTDDMI